MGNQHSLGNTGGAGGADGVQGIRIQSGFPQLCQIVRICSLVQQIFVFKHGNLNLFPQLRIHIPNGYHSNRPHLGQDGHHALNGLGYIDGHVEISAHCNTHKCTDALHIPVNQHRHRLTNHIQFFPNLTGNLLCTAPKLRVGNCLMLVDKSVFLRKTPG